MTIRVLHFYKTYYPDSFGGGEHVIREIAAGTAPLGIDSTVLSLSRDPGRNTVTLDGHRAIKASILLEPASTPFSLDALRKFRELAREADIIHYHFPWPFMDVAHLLHARGKPALVTYHSDVVRQRFINTFYRPLMHRFLSDMKAIVATSPQYAETSPVLARYRDRVEIIPLGMADRRDELDPDKVARWRRELPTRFFLFTGALRYYKGLETLLQAARDVGQTIVIIGGGRREAYWRGRAEGLSNMRFLGAVDDADKFAILSLATGLVFPSDLRAEAFGLSLVEAAMFERPMISCEIGTGTSYVNVDHQTGIVVPPRDPGALASAMRTLARDPALGDTLGQAARKRYESLFTRERMAASYAELYRRLAKPKA